MKYAVEQAVSPQTKRCATIGRERSGVKRRKNSFFEFSRMAVVGHNTGSSRGELNSKSEFRGRGAVQSFSRSRDGKPHTAEHDST
jgi:hypothetical protein